MSAKTDLKAEIFADFEEEELTFLGVITEEVAGTYNAVTNITTGGTSTPHNIRFLFDESNNTERTRELIPEVSVTDRLTWLTPDDSYIPKKGDILVSTEFGSDLSIVFIIENSVGVNGLFKGWLR